MALRKIVYDGEPLLRKQSREVKDITPRIRTLIEDMWETLYEANGVGLAAPQVGVLRRVIVIDTTPPPGDSDEDDEVKSDDDGMDSPDSVGREATGGVGEAHVAEEGISDDSVGEAEAPPIPQKYTLINPELVWVSEETQCSKEGCLSVPGRIATVTRPEKVRVKALDEEGRAVEIEADGLLAKALQHEIDHLNGIVIVDIADEIEEVRNEQE